MADPTFIERNVVIRIVKPYAGAGNHIYTGKVVAYDGRFIAIDGRVMSFGKGSTEDPTGGLTTSSRATRWVALQRIEYIRELPKNMDPFSPENTQVASDGSLSFRVTDRPDLLPE